MTTETLELTADTLRKLRKADRLCFYHGKAGGKLRAVAVNPQAARYEDRDFDIVAEDLPSRIDTRGKREIDLLIDVGVCEPNSARMVKTEAERNGWVPLAPYHAHRSAVECAECDGGASK